MPRPRPAWADAAPPPPCRRWAPARNAEPVDLREALSLGVMALRESDLDRALYAAERLERELVALRPPLRDDR